MTELEKCMAGECYNCHDEIFLEFKARARALLKDTIIVWHMNRRKRKQGF